MFLGELGINGLRDIGGIIKMDGIPIPGTIGYTVSSVYESKDGKVRAFYLTNIPEEVWSFPESQALKREVLRIIRPPKNCIIKKGFEEETRNVCLQITTPRVSGKVDLSSPRI